MNSHVTQQVPVQTSKKVHIRLASRCHLTTLLIEKGQNIKTLQGNKNNV